MLYKVFGDMENVCRYYIFMCIPGLGAPSEKFKRPAQSAREIATGHIILRPLI